MKVAPPRANTARIVDVARVAGVSPQTVSNVVNGRGGYTEETRRLVMTAIERTGFRINRAAQQLRTKRAGQVGFSLWSSNFDLRSPFTLWFLQAVVDAAAAVAQRVVAVPSAGDGDLGDMAAWAESGDVDGFVLCNVTPGDARVSWLARQGVPFAVMGRTRPDEPQTWVDIDSRFEIGRLVDHMVAAGYASFGYLGDGGTSHWTLERLAGVRDGLARHGLPLDDRWVCTGTYDAVARRLEEVLRAPDRPSVLMTGSDSLALLATTSARSHGLVVGRDLVITGFDEGPLSWLLENPGPTVRVPVDTIAAAVLRRLITEVEQGPTAVPGEVVPCEIVVRDGP